jgi:hypothetical protein
LDTSVTDLDSLIDAAACEMTTASSPVNLRARVLEEIARGTDEAEASYHEPPYRRWWLAAAAGIVLAAYLSWPERPTIEFPPSPVVRTQAGPQLPIPPADGRAPTSRAGRAPAAREPDVAIASIPALEGPAAIGIAPLDATSNPVPALDAVEPLDLEQLDIKPLTPPGPAAGGQ